VWKYLTKDESHGYPVKKVICGWYFFPGSVLGQTKKMLVMVIKGHARRGCGAGAGLENLTRAGIHFRLNVCYNKKGCFLIIVLCQRGLHML